MIEIPLTKNKVAIVSKKDYQELSQYKWCANEYSSGKWRAKRATKDGTIYMHRQLLKVSKGQIVDHINGDGLDNRRENLRLVDKQRNSANSRTSSKSRYKGVEVRNTYRAYITVDNNRIWLGKFNTNKEAAECYDKIAREWFGEYACLNFQTKCE